MNYPAPPDKRERTMKEALVAAGIMDKSKFGRGRPSKEMVTHTKGLVAAGWVITNYSVSSPSPGDDSPKVERTKVTTGILDVPDQARDERDWRAEATTKDGKPVKVGMREVCSTPNCRNSLTYCRCGNPTFRVDFDYVSPVRFIGIRAKEALSSS